MTITIIIMSAISLLLSAAALAYCVKLTLVYHRFNEQIAVWGKSLDDEMEKSIYLASRRLLESLDARITENNNQQNQDKDNDENQLQPA